MDHSIYHICPLVGFCNNVLNVLTERQIAENCDTKVTTRSDNGKWHILNMKLVSSINTTNAKHTTLAYRYRQLPFVSPLT